MDGNTRCRCGGMVLMWQLAWTVDVLDNTVSCHIQAARSRQAAVGTNAGAPARPANTRVLVAGRAVRRKRQTPDLP